ncbi:MULTISPECIES: P-II family nitrogen regulator [Methanobacterium]|jgi:nitrogen regulatory protein PII|uniref:P-II family nitrogen regulator n=1 Tax=Methanobacterium subterraneum TaxID=59277 RepID=A0A2H4VB19_9EURY|nr:MULTISPECIES: P-II family nitrogen regulator [Methanobacterium]MBW4256316.1 P-II family nitrogen regulator [Methanobacterium sp. YSL]PKL73930.1 MAG: transcriptional regulator [Methanobacteriales archaeon HGW-Methanobacteriales-2]AUB55283.1 hypothetical protein BK007_04130 [Methanobacterium subterraneum]AUB57740.1 hypothetical protein BK008_05050 [Methanobacterium sp. MZ-A1]MCC7560970.1 P-II family nitrogen regulator [Methanobacterium sp.]
MNNTCSSFKLIYVIVEAGRGSHIMESARKAGAEGGTIYFGRGTSIHEHGKFFGMPIEPEKEVVMIVIKESLVNQVFEAIVLEGEINTPGKGIAFILDVDRVAGICHLNEHESK